MQDSVNVSIEVTMERNNVEIGTKNEKRGKRTHHPSGFAGALTRTGSLAVKRRQCHLHNAG
jgi:hypothetical protein